MDYIRAATKKRFHDYCNLQTNSNDHFVYKMSENNENTHYSFPRARGDILIVLSDQQSETQRYSVYYHKTEKSSNLFSYVFRYMVVFLQIKCLRISLAYHNSSHN